MAQLFSGLRVIDAASFLAGPCAATMLSDFGAEVIKIEPLAGDGHRSLAGGHPSEHSWQLTDRNRRSLALDLRQPEGRAVLLRMLPQVDVLVVNFSAAQLDKYGLQWPALQAINPKLILAQISAYGNEGPDAERRAFDLAGWFARTGMLDMMRNQGERPPMPAGGVGDHATAMTLYAGILMALYKRERTGEGSFVSTSLAAAGTWANGLNLQAVLAGVDTAARRDEEGFSNPLVNVYRTSDDRFVLMAMQNVVRDWPKFVALMQRPQWLEEPRMQLVKPLFRHREWVKAELAAAIGLLDAEAFCALLSEAGIVHSLVARNAEVIDDEQLNAIGAFVPYETDRPGVERTLATPIRLTDEPPRPPRQAPGIGEHSEAILTEFGWSAEELASLKREGIILQARDDNPPGS